MRRRVPCRGPDRGASREIDVPTAPAAFVAAHVLAGGAPHELFAACEAAGRDIAAVMDVLGNPFAHLSEGDAWEVEEMLAGIDPVFHLVEHAGVSAAAEIAARTAGWAGVDVEALHRGVAAVRCAEAAFTEGVDLLGAYRRIADEAVPNENREGLLRRLAHVYPLAELAALAPEIPGDHARTIGRVLRDRLTPLQAFEALHAEVEIVPLRAALENFWSVPLRAPSEPKDALLDTYATLLCRELQSLSAALPLARRSGAPAWWLPILRRHGLKASRGALELLESGMAPADIAELLAAAGYDDDEVLAALLENAIGPRVSLSMLRDSGWEVARMVEALAGRGLLPSELRRHLEDLGVGIEMQRLTLGRHWSTPLVELVLEGHSPRARLTRGDRTDE